MSKVPLKLGKRNQWCSRGFTLGATVIPDLYIWLPRGTRIVRCLNASADNGSKEYTGVTATTYKDTYMDYTSTNLGYERDLEIGTVSCLSPGNHTTSTVQKVYYILITVKIAF